MEKHRFSPSGECFAVAGSDGKIRIWETATNILKQEYVSTSHLSAMCTCFKWAPCTVQSKKKKKRKKVIQGEVIAIGTAVGSICCYSVTEAKVLVHSNEAHSGQVSDITWNSSSSTLYSCGEDGYIIVWDAETANTLSRWKGGKGALTNIQLCESEKYLLVASRGVFMWDVKTQTLLSSFTGHPGLVNQLEIIPSLEYFISMSYSEMNLRIWSMSEKTAIAVLSLSELPTHFHVVSSSNGSVSVAVSTKKGQLNIFQHKLNGQLKKPLTAVTTLHITDKAESSQTVPIFSGYLTAENDVVSVLLGYGSWVKLRFETLDISSMNGTVTIEREFASRKKALKRTEVEQRTEVPNDVKHLHPGSEVTSKSTTKRKATEESKPLKGDAEELPMEERLTNLTIDTPLSGIIPDGSNLAHVLSQGLHSKDARILHSVLSRWDENVVSTTIRSLPVQLIIPLLNEIKVLLGGKAQLNHCILKWLKSVLQIHSAYLMSCTLSEDLLTPFMSLLLTREALYPQMCQLRGKLELMKGNIKAKNYSSETSNEALLVFQDESSGEDNDEDDGMMPSESEDFLASDDLGVEGEDDSGSESITDGERGSNMDDDFDDDEDVPNAKSKPKLKSNKKNTSTIDESDEEMEDDDDEG